MKIIMKNINIIILIIVNIWFTSNGINGYKILGVLTSPSKSHFIVHNSVMKELAARGHEVTVFSLFPEEKPIKNYRTIYMEPSGIDHEYNKLMEKILNNAESGNNNPLMLLPALIKTMLNKTNATINSPEMMELLSSTTQSFDLMILGYFLNDFHLGIAGHFKCPSVIIMSGPPTPLITHYVGNPTAVSYSPHVLLNFKTPMTFIERMFNFLANTLEYFFGIFFAFIQNYYYNENFPSDKYPTFDEVQKNVSLLMVSHHFSQGGIRANVPAIIEIGGIQSKVNPSPLPQDIQNFLDNANDGAIFFSLGSNIKSSTLPPEKIQELLKTFSKLKQKVLWKWEDDKLPGKPDNVFIGKWLPQDDILAHPNLKLFISHGGLGSVTESKFHGVPVLGIPIFADQIKNIQTIADEGWGLLLPYTELSESTLHKSILEILNNNKYKETVGKMSKLFRDRPLSALDTATFWIEYVLRHNGAKHLQSPAVHLNFFQYHSLDVLAVFGIIIYFVCHIFKMLLRRCCRKSKDTTASRKSKRE